MHEFDLIQHYFKSLHVHKEEVILGIGDDCAGLHIPAHQDLWVTTDTLVENIHFLSTWSGYDVAYKSLMVNLSDCAAMGAEAFAFSLALTLPEPDDLWLTSFAQGLKAVMDQHQVALIGGDTTRGPRAITISVYGLGSRDTVVRRSGAASGDVIFVSGPLGLAALGVDHLTSLDPFEPTWVEPVRRALHYPQARLDCCDLLRRYATSCIDISDGFVADLNHVCQASNTGARIFLHQVPIHPVLTYWHEQGFGKDPLYYALHGGDDYELCFTISPNRIDAFKNEAESKGFHFYAVGEMTDTKKISGLNEQHECVELNTQGYQHF